MSLIYNQMLGAFGFDVGSECVESIYMCSYSIIMARA